MTVYPVGHYLVAVKERQFFGNDGWDLHACMYGKMR